MKKVTEEELVQITNLRNSLLEIITTIGELNISKLLVEKQLKDLDEQLEEQNEKFFQFQDSERVLFEELRGKYGAGDIDMETGEITE
jgi:hypothetical protein